MKVSLPPVTPTLADLQGGPKTTGVSTEATSAFKNMLAEVNHLQQQADTKVGRLLLGKEDLHEAMLALEKANMSLRLLVQVRNRLVQAYEELSRMPL